MRSRGGYNWNAEPRGLWPPCWHRASHPHPLPASLAGWQDPTQVRLGAGVEAVTAWDRSPTFIIFISSQLVSIWQPYRSAIRGLLAIAGSVWRAALPGWGGYGTARQLSSPMRGTARLSAPDDPDCMPFHGCFLHPDCTGNPRRKSFASLILNRNLWLRVTMVACYREQIHKGVYPRAWC